jgi:hypothetical protein
LVTWTAFSAKKIRTLLGRCDETVTGKMQWLLLEPFVSVSTEYACANKCLLTNEENYGRRIGVLISAEDLGRCSNREDMGPCFIFNAD